MYKCILLPIDPTHITGEDQVLDLAEHLKAQDGKIILLSVIEEIPTYVASQIPEGLLADAATNAVNGLEELVKQRGMDATVLVKSGHAAATIKAVQQEHDCDLIIISSHKPTAIDYLLGSTASKVVSRAQCPVFVTR